MQNRALKARVDRLIGGDYRPEDLTHIFLALRSSSYGRESIRELGDFVAHRAERTKGIATQRVRDFYTLFPTYLWTAGKQIQGHDLPDDHIDFLNAAYRMFGPKTINEKTGINANRSKRMLENIVANIKRLPNGKLAITYTPNNDEQRLLNFLANRTVWVPAFDDEILVDEFRAVLEKNRLTSPADTDKVIATKGLLSAFALSSMHQAHLIEKTVNAYIECGTWEGNLIAMSTMSLPDIPVPTLFPIFKTKAQAIDWCVPSLIGKSPHINWECAIELTAQVKLAPLSGETPFTENPTIIDDGKNIALAGF